MTNKKHEMTSQLPLETKDLMADLRQIIDSARARVATTANYELTMMYWRIGERINRDVLANQRAEYGKQIVSTLARQLQAVYGTRGFEPRSIRRMMQFASKFPDLKIVSTLSTKLSWSHFIEILSLSEPLQSEFYLTLAASERWSVRTLREKIDGMLYERTAIATKPDELVRKELAELRDDNALSPDLVFKSPYFLEFTGLKGMYSEKSLEDSLLAHLEQFINELGNGFCFIARQKRMIIDGEDFYLDLLFYHRRLHRLIAIDLKLGRFKAQYKGQMELYLRWLEKYERVEGENTPIGLILCAGKNDEHVELMHLEESNIRVAEYLTMLPDKKLLEQKLQRAIAYARERIAILEQDKL